MATCQPARYRFLFSSGQGIFLPHSVSDSTEYSPTSNDLGIPLCAGVWVRDLVSCEGSMSSCSVRLAQNRHGEITIAQFGCQHLVC
jgi:hypothetical protein